MILLTFTKWPRTAIDLLFRFVLLVSTILNLSRFFHHLLQERTRRILQSFKINRNIYTTWTMSFTDISKLCLDSRFQWTFRLKWWKGHYWLVEHKDLLHSIYWRLGSLCRKPIAFTRHWYICKQSIAKVRDAKMATVESIEAYYWYWITFTR